MTAANGRRGRNAHAILLGVAALVILIPGVRLLFDPSGYAAGKANLMLTADLHNELRAAGSIFVATAVVMLAGAFVGRLRFTATVVGLVAFLPQGLARVISYSADTGQHDSYLRAGIVETIIGVVLAAFVALRSRDRAVSP